MRDGLRIGAIGELTWTVDPTMTITLGGMERATIFSTPNMIMLMERAAREALRPYLEDGEESVGVEVQVEHSGAAPLGSLVHGVARVTRIDERKIDFEIRAFCGPKEIGRGTHRRAVIQLQRFVEKLEGELPARNSNTGTTNLNQASPAPGWETLQVAVENRIATVRLNRPQALNAVNIRMTDELEQLVGWLKQNPESIRVVIVTGNGTAFCAGDDVKELPGLSSDAARELSLRQARTYLAFEQLPQPIIAAVNGPALGGGCVLAYSCDFRLASHQARFGMPEIKLGWPPGYGLSQLMSMVGKPRALEMCLLGESISASTAKEWGLVHDLVPAMSLQNRSLEMAEKMLALPAEALRRTKQLLHADEGALPKVTHRADTEAYVRCLELPDAQEGIAAFAQKRTPRFKGH